MGENFGQLSGSVNFPRVIVCEYVRGCRVLAQYLLFMDQCLEWVRMLGQE